MVPDGNVVNRGRPATGYSIFRPLGLLAEPLCFARDYRKSPKHQQFCIQSTSLISLSVALLCVDTEAVDNYRTKKKYLPLGINIGYVSRIITLDKSLRVMKIFEKSLLWRPLSTELAVFIHAGGNVIRK